MAVGGRQGDSPPNRAARRKGRGLGRQTRPSVAPSWMHVAAPSEPVHAFGARFGMRLRLTRKPLPRACERRVASTRSPNAPLPGVQRLCRFDSPRILHNGPGPWRGAMSTLRTERIEETWSEPGPICPRPGGHIDTVTWKSTPSHLPVSGQKIVKIALVLGGSLSVGRSAKWTPSPVSTVLVSCTVCQSFRLQ